LNAIVIFSNVSEKNVKTALQPAWLCGVVQIQSAGLECVRVTSCFVMYFWFFTKNILVYPVLSADPGWRVEADNRKESCDLQPTDEQLLICDQVSRERTTCRERQRKMPNMKMVDSKISKRKHVRQAILETWSGCLFSWT